MQTPLSLAISSSLLLAGAVTAQSVLPPFDSTYQVINFGSPAGFTSYGGTAFLPSNPNVLLVSVYPSNTIRAVPLSRSQQGYINGFGASAVVASVGGTDGGLAFGPGGVLFATWYGPNRLSQIKPGSTSTDRVDDLGPLGVASSVGACTFVPPGLPGAGRFKVCGYGGNDFYDMPLTPDGTGTYAPGAVGPATFLTGGIEGLVYTPPAMAMIGGRLLAAEWSAGNVAAYQIDSIGNPLPATRQVVIAGLANMGGGAVDPITGDIVFTGGSGNLVVLRNGSACGTFTAYGTASPGASGTPTLTGAGCLRIGQTIAFTTHHAANSVGLLALGYSPTNINYNGLLVLQSLNVTVVSVTNGLGDWSFPLSVPLTPTLGNAHVYLQAAYLDASTPSGFVGTAGLDVLIR